MNFLIDIIPPKSRRYVYGVLSLLALVYATWQASDGHWGAMLTSLLSGAVTALAHANTSQANEPEPEPTPAPKAGLR